MRHGRPALPDGQRAAHRPEKLPQELGERVPLTSLIVWTVPFQQQSAAADMPSKVW